MNEWQTVPLPLFAGGEDSGAGPLASSLANRIENGVLTGAGSVDQEPDWRLAATCTDGSNENAAVCGIFPFATQGGASAASAGIVFSFDQTDDTIFLHQLGEDGSILRTLTAWTGYTETAPPQITGFELFGKFYANAYGREAAASRLGMLVFDPTGAGTVSVPTFDLSAGGAAAARLRFRGIALHRDALPIGWGYLNEETGNIDQPQCVRYAKYTAPDTWVADTTESSAGFFNCGRLNTPVIGCAPSGQYMILGKEREVFAMDGDYGAYLYPYRPIGSAHGPVSTAGIVSTGPLAVWMDRDGYVCLSEQGGFIKLLSPDRLARRRLTYYDLGYTCAWHEAAHTRVAFLLRRRTTLAGAALTDKWATEILYWDYERDAFTFRGIPTACFSGGTIAGPGITLTAPSGTPASLGRTATSSSAALTWTHAGGDPTAQIAVEYRVSGAVSYTVAGLADPGALTWTLTGLTASTLYEWRLRYFKNGQYGSYANGTDFTTSAASAVGTPSGLSGSIVSSYPYGGKTYSVARLAWTRGEFASGSQTLVYEGSTSTFAAASVIQTLGSAQVSIDVTKLVESPATVRYYWVRHQLADGTQGTEAGAVTVTFELP